MASPSNGGEIIMDSHHHFWDLGRFQYPWMTDRVAPLRRNYLPEDMKPLLKATGVQQTVLVQAHQSVEETRWFLELAEANDFVGGVVGWVDLDSPDVGQVLDELVKHPKLKGIRHLVHDEKDDSWLMRADVRRGLAEVAKRNLTYDLLVRPQHLRFIPLLAEMVPGLRMVVDHIAKPPIASGQLEPWASRIAAVAAIPGMYCKISGMVTEADWSRWTVEDLKPYVHHVVEKFGFDRVMWGSDWPVCTLAAPYQRVLESALEALGPISSEERSKFLGRNAIKFYRLS